jgi:hypothetical protein
MPTSGRYILAMASNEYCESCDYRWSAVPAEEIPERLSEATAAFVLVVDEAGPLASVRPTNDRWSILEYGAHLRDVLISIRDRIIAASVQEEATGAPIYRDERVDLGFYKLDTRDDVMNEIAAASNLFVRTFKALPPQYERRTFLYSPVTPVKVTILWAGEQALHECLHHLSDVRENLTLLAH